MKDIAFNLPGGQSINAPGNIPQGGLSNGYVQTIVGNGVNILLILAVILSIIFIAWAGFQWATSGGDKSKLSAARSKLTWAIVGLIITFFAFAILQIIAHFFNAPIT
jgi:uncharacterized membrane protein